MTARLGFREGAVSAVVFGAVLFGLMTVDPRVREHVTQLAHSGSVMPMGDRIGDLGSALWSAARDKSLDNAPLLVFVSVGALLTVFMLRT